MNRSVKSAFAALLAFACCAGFASAQEVSFDTTGGLSDLIAELKDGNHNGDGRFANVPQPTPVHLQNNGRFGRPNHGNNGHGNGNWNHGNGNDNWNHGNGNDNWNHGNGNDNWNHGNNNHGNGNWHPHHNGHPDWHNNNWGNNNWNHHGQDHNGWWSNYDQWWLNNLHPYSQYRTVCDIIPGSGAKGYIVENTEPFYGKAMFYYYDIYNNLILSSNLVSKNYRGGDGTPIVDSYPVSSRADRCFLAITRN